MTLEAPTFEDRILVVAPRGRDKTLLGSALERAKFEAALLPGMEDLSGELARGAGVLLLEEEALDRGASRGLESLKSQPPWSSLPIIILTSQNRLEKETQHLMHTLGPDLNVVLLERPIRTLTLLQTVRSALRARRRQYEVRDFQDNLANRVAERTRLLEEALDEMNAFSYSIAHDLRAPLRAIHRFGEILESDYGTGRALDEGGLGYVHEILAGATRMDALIQNLLRYSRLSRAEVKLTAIELGTFMPSVLREMEPEILERKARITVEVPSGAVLADRVLLAQALTNLISNAIKFVPPGREPVIRVRAEDRGMRTRIWVEDNGIGIDPRYHARIFKVFERLDSSFPGTGIGLAIVRRVVDRQGGSSGVESELGGGSRFWIELRRP